MINHCINAPVADRLGDNALSIVSRSEVQADRDVGERDAAVGQVDSAQASADHVVVQPRDEVVGAVRAEDGNMGLGNLEEGGESWDEENYS